MASIAESLTIALQHHQAGRLQEAEVVYRQILQTQPQHPDALHLLGVVAHQRGCDDVAIELIAKAIALNPSVPEYHNNLGNALQERGEFDAAIASLRRAVALNPGYAEAHANLGNVLSEQDRLEEAITCYRQALFLKSDYPGARMNLGNAFRAFGRINEALECYRRVLRLDPGFTEARWNMSLALLLSGQFQEGWREYECRWELERARGRKRSFSQPEWDGSDIRGRTILVYVEQGIGDTLQFIRYAPLVAKRGARVVVECHPSMQSLVATVEGVAQVVAQGDALPEFDVHASLLSLPRICGTTLDTIPANVPYFTPHSRLACAWKGKLASDQQSFKVGLAWAGGSSDRKRDCPLALFAPLAKVRGVTFHSLQKGEAEKQAVDPPHGMVLRDVSSALNDFADTAALIGNLDLVITIDTSVAHLAGAMGKPVWTMLRFAADWRWLLKREDSPWYPTMRLFRQGRPGDWPGVVADVAEALGQLMRRREK